ncbi:histidine kinase [Methylobacterium platani JCM 14648]|uniref:histidine kinase n=3 Tax=Methylobacterium platani TaxID=427683 RepID=A0A179RXA5_9HYPH|nr:histidine kinase [Methylobacterium platani JCM 14648]OAS14249.1 two-component sensor histidine kinase [Methylobacterium platani]
MLILLGALSALVLATVALDHWQRREVRHLYPTPYPRIDQAAGIVALLHEAPPAQRAAILRAVSGQSLRAEIRRDAPPEGPTLLHEPGIEARLRRLAGLPEEAELKAYTDRSMLYRGIDPARAAEDSPGRLPLGRLARATYRLPDGRVVVIDALERPRGLALFLFGQPLSLWVAGLGVLVAGLALLGARNEIAPLRRLTAAVARFDGRTPEPVPSGGGAPEIRRLAAAVRAMQERIAGLLSERSLLIGAISHDLKTYLTRLRLRAEGVADPTLSARIIADLDAMTDLIETSLTFARGTSVEARRSGVDLADLVAAEVAEQAALGAAIGFSGEDVADAVVAGDAVALRRVIANLIQNAVTYGRAAVAVRVERVGATCRVVVDDDGPGIPEGERDAVFSPFYRVERSRSRRTGGTGLGLAIARQIVEAHGGALSAAAADLGGARLVVELPAA